LTSDDGGRYLRLSQKCLEEGKEDLTKADWTHTSEKLNDAAAAVSKTAGGDGLDLR
jgi:hypothetical protein